MKILLALIFIYVAMNAQSQDSIKKYTQAAGGYIMVLRQGDNIIYELEQLAQKENIPSATITGIGFVNITFGYFDFKTKQYKPGSFKNVELASLTGSIAWKDDKPSIHTHGVVGDENFQSHAGHILEATVSTGSVEIRITLHSQKLQRKKDEQLGADILEVP